MRCRVVVLLGAVCGVTALALGPAALGAGAAMPDRRQMSVSERAPEKNRLTTAPVLPKAFAGGRIYCLKDDPSDWNWYDGAPVGRHDGFIDVRLICAGFYKPDASKLDNLEREYACGVAGVVCSPSQLAFTPGEGLLVVTAVMDGSVSMVLEPGFQARFSVAVDLGGDPSTKSRATPSTPNLYSDGMNGVWELDSEVPAGSGLVSFADDRREANEFIETKARYWLHGRSFIAVIPVSELDGIQAIRFADTFGVQGAGGDPAQNNSDVAPGGKDGPFPTLGVECLQGKLKALKEAGKCKKVIAYDLR